MTRPFIPRRACVREKAHKGKKRHERARDSTKRRRDATHTHTHTHTHTKYHASARIPPRARANVGDARLPVEDVPALALARIRLPGAPEQTSQAGGVGNTHAPRETDLRTPKKKNKKQQTKTKQKTKRQRGFPACSQASTNAPQAGLSSLFRWGRLIFCWCERLMGDNVRRVSITMMTCIGRDTLTGHLCTTRLP